MAQLKSDPKYLGFQKVTVLTKDETKPWKPPLTVEVTLADGSKEVIPAATPFFTFVTDGGELTVSAAACGHIQDLHLRGEDLGSRFDFASLEDLFQAAAERLPDGIASAPGVSSFALEMGRQMGTEGIATMQELVSDGVITPEDVETAQRFRPGVRVLNKEGGIGTKDVFLQTYQSENPTCRVQFQLVRGDVVVPTVVAPKRPTTKLFMVFGPAEGQPGKTLYTAAPGRWMPRHPNPAQFRPEEGGTDGAAFTEALDAWFNTVMLKS
jgi:hypothetical protein